MIALNYLHSGPDQGDTMYGFLAGINYDNVFMAQGLVDQIYYKE